MLQDIARHAAKFLTDAAAFVKGFSQPVATVKNDSGERIETLRFSVPALRVGVLNYAPGQLTTKNESLAGKEVRLYYPPEAVGDAEFLKSLENSPIILGGHNASTNEQDKKIDGWPRIVRYDEAEQAAIIEGVVKGAKESAYVRANFQTPEFGASAMIDVHGLEVREGVTPDGQQFNAVATKLRATHVTLAPYVRDPDNKIEIINAVAINSLGTLSGNTANKPEVKNMDQKELAALVANTVKEVLTAKNSEDRMGQLEKTVNALKNAVEELQKGKAENVKDEEAKEEVKNEDEEKKEEPATLENAVPSQKLVGAFVTAFNADFKGRTPSFETLAALAGIKAESRADVITAVNAKFAEIESKTAVKVENAKPVPGGVF